MVNVLLNYYNFDGDWAYFHLCKYLNPHMRVTVLPLAFRNTQAWDDASWQALYGSPEVCSGGGEKYGTIVNAFLRFGIYPKDITFVNFFSCNGDTAVLVERTDVLLFCGGLPEKMMERLEILGLTETIKRYSGVVLGVSAGAMVQLDNYHITPDDDYAGYIAQNAGLGLVRGFDVEVHFEDTQVQRQAIGKAIFDNKKPVLAMRHEGGIIVDGSAKTLMGKIEVFEVPC